MHRDKQTEFIELKTQDNSIPDNLVKSVIAFANSEGGDIYIGVSQEVNIIGI